MGEKLILKDYLIGRNYELERINKELKEKCEAQAQVIDLFERQVATIEWKERIATELQASYKEYFERYERLYKIEEKKKRKWRTAAAVTAGIAATTTIILIAK